MYQTKEMMTIIRVVVKVSGTLIVPYSVKPIIMPKSKKYTRKRLQNLRQRMKYELVEKKKATENLKRRRAKG